MDISKVNLSSLIPVDKVVHEFSGSFTYSFLSEGPYTIANPEPGSLFLPFSIFQIDGEDTFFTDMDGLWNILTCVNVTNINYRWAYRATTDPDFTMHYRTALLALDV